MDGIALGAYRLLYPLWETPLLREYRDTHVGALIREDARGILQGLKQLSDSLMAVSPAYRCGRCGFGARAHHWQCPSCKSWGTIKPMPGAACD